jgi:hypothetical protein
MLKFSQLFGLNYPAFSTMVNPFAEVNWKPDLAERRKFAKSLVIGFPCLALILLLGGWIGKGKWDANLGLAIWLGGGGILAGAVFWAVPQMARPFYMVWYFLACCLGIVIGNLVLALFYYLILTPFGLIKRVIGKPALTKGFDKNATTYWKEAHTAEDPARYYKQF